jgi:hypothetical protein
MVVFDNRGISFYEIIDSQPPRLLGESLSQFAIEGYEGSAQWTILDARSFAVSPNAQHIAFTARGESEAAQFIYSNN